MSRDVLGNLVTESVYLPTNKKAWENEQLEEDKEVLAGVDLKTKVHIDEKKAERFEAMKKERSSNVSGVKEEKPVMSGYQPEFWEKHWEALKRERMEDINALRGRVKSDYRDKKALQAFQ